MSRVRMKWNLAAFAEIRSRSETRNLVDSYLADALANAGPGYDGNAMQGKRRYRAIVFPKAKAAYRDNARNNTLVKIVGGSR